jgi:ABC-type uncharacterized transport system auxiliary subunit
MQIAAKPGRKKRRNSTEPEELSIVQLDAIIEATQNMRVCETTRKQYLGLVKQYKVYSDLQLFNIDSQENDNDGLISHIVRFLTHYADGNNQLSVNNYVILVCITRKNG